MSASEKENASSGQHHHKKHMPHMHEEHEHEEGWIVSFADNVLLMMGFFVVMLAMNMKPTPGVVGGGSSDGNEANASMLDLAIAVRDAFHNPVDLTSTDPNDQALIRRILERKNQGKVRDASPDGQGHKVQTVRPSDWAGHGAVVMFQENSALLSDDAKFTIGQLASQIVGKYWMIDVRGGVSALESHGDERQGRDLAFDRAWAVGVELVKDGLSWNQIRLVSCGDSEPVIPRTATQRERSLNERAEILVTNDLMPPDPYREETEGP